MPAQQPIIFSRPVENGTSEKANSFMNAEPTRHTSGAFNAPTPMFSGNKAEVSFDQLPSANQVQRPISPAEQKAWEKILEGKNKWAMMTPEEILGIPTAEKILGLPEKNDESKLSVEQRYLNRQERATLFTATNGYRRPDFKPRDGNNPFAKNDAQTKSDHLFEQPNGAAEKIMLTGAPKFLDDVFGLAPTAPLTPQQRQTAAWGNTFDLPPPPAKQTPEQLAGMDRFRALMEPSAALEKTLPAARTPLPLARDPYLQAAPQFNPLGGAAKALRNEASQAIGIKPLPSLIRQPLVTPPPSPTQVQLPPWLRDEEATPKLKVGRF